MGTIKNLLETPWPWYVSGALLGLIVPILLLLSNKQFGISSSFRHICAIGIKRLDYFQYDWKKKGAWQLIFVGGCVLAGTLLGLGLEPNSGELSSSLEQLLSHKGVEIKGILPVSFFKDPSTWWYISLGGVLIGFGSRYAGGCTSGHAIMGLSTFSLGSLISVAGFFIGGIIGVKLLIEYLL